MPIVELQDQIIHNPVVHIRTLRGGNEYPEVSITRGPVEEAANEIITDLTLKCRLEVRRTGSTRIGSDNRMTRAHFEVDVLHDHQLMTWDHIVMDPTRPYRRLEVRR